MNDHDNGDGQTSIDTIGLLAETYGETIAIVALVIVAVFFIVGGLVLRATRRNRGEP